MFISHLLDSRSPIKSSISYRNANARKRNLANETRFSEWYWLLPCDTGPCSRGLKPRFDALQFCLYFWEYLLKLYLFIYSHLLREIGLSHSTMTGIGMKIILAYKIIYWLLPSLFSIRARIKFELLVLWTTYANHWWSHVGLAFSFSKYLTGNSVFWRYI